MKMAQTNLHKCSSDRFLRNDVKYHLFITACENNIFSTSPEHNVPLSEVIYEEYINFIFEPGVEYKGIPTGKAYIDEDGDIIDYQIITEENHPSRLKYQITNDNILLSSLRLAKSPALMFDNIDLSEYVFSNGFYVFKVKNGWNKKFVLYLLRTKTVKKLLDKSLYRGIGISSYRSEDLLKCTIRNVSITEQNDAIKKITPIENTIRKLKKSIKNPKEIIDFIFEKYFLFDYHCYYELKKIKNYTIRKSDFANNPDLRFSAKFHRESGKFVVNQLTEITTKKIKHFLAEPIILGASVSPEDYSDDGSYKYISMATIKNWHFNTESANAVSDTYAESKKTKTVRKGDIIMARSGEGTIGKVALITDEEINGIFADFTMRIRLKDYNPEFAYYYFRTEYFQYLIEIYKKGLGNNTNIFPIVIQEFPMINISVEEQQRIVDEIHDEILKQDEIKKQISDLRLEIDRIVENTIREGVTE